MAAWRLARALIRLRNEMNTEYPGRDRASDGSIGDAAHAGRKSDHNPNAAGVVRAHDFDDDIIATDDTVPFELAEHLRQLGLSGFRPLQNGGLIIYFARYCSANTGWAWRPYDGINAHKSHLHVSVGRDADQYDNENPWRISQLTEEPPMTKIEDVHAGVMIAIAEAREEDKQDDLRDNLTYRNTHEMWSELISGEVGWQAQPNGTPAYQVRADMLRDVLNVPSIVRTIEDKAGELLDLVGEDGEDGRTVTQRLDDIEGQMVEVMDTMRELVERLERAELAR